MFHIIPHTEIKFFVKKICSVMWYNLYQLRKALYVLSIFVSKSEASVTTQHSTGPLLQIFNNNKYIRVCTSPKMLLGFQRFSFSNSGFLTRSDVYSLLQSQCCCEAGVRIRVLPYQCTPLPLHLPLLILSLKW